MRTVILLSQLYASRNKDIYMEFIAHQSDENLRFNFTYTD
jgi:hypothetical protein